jgi:hypothetical protein
MYLHLRPSSRQDQPFDDMDDDTILMEIDAQHSLAPHTDQDLGDAIMAAYERLGLT